MAKLYSFPMRMKLLRQKKGLTQEQLAYVLGCSKQSISNFECGRYKPGLPYMRRFCEFMRKPLKHFWKELDL